MPRARQIVFLLAMAWPALAAAQGQPPSGTFRAGVDVVAVDVHVVDKDSRPVPGLTPDQFTVTIDGKKRRVLSADYFDSAAQPDASGARASAPAGPSGQSRQIFMLAIDASSFRPTLSRNITDAAKRFVARLRPDDEIGLYTFPNGPKIGVTTDHASVARALDGVIGQADMGGGDRFHLSPGDLIDLSLWAEGAGRAGRPALVDRLCGAGTDSDANCVDALRNQVHANAAYYEGRAHASLGMFRGMLSAFTGMPGRTVVVLLSAGMVASDAVGARPDLGDFGIRIGKDASAANVNVYTVFVDQRWLEEGSAENRYGRNPESRLARDSEVLGRWLDQFSGAAGGVMFKVVAGDGGPIFDRILRETSSYYLLGVEPAREDRDGRAHGIRVKVSARDALVRSRQWVTVPVARVAASVAAAPAAAAVREPVRLPATPPAPPTPSPALAPLIAAFERGDDSGVVEGVLRSQDAVRLIQDFRNVSGLLWSGAPRREALLGLDIAVAALRRRNPDEERGAAALIAQANILVRQTEPADAFECTWYRLEAAGLLSLLRPAVALPFIGQGLQRCPREGQLALGRAIALEQQWPLQPLPVASGSAPLSPTPEQLRDVPAAYEQAMADPSTAAEARTRLAWFYFRYGQLAKARATIDAVTAPAPDPRVRYFTSLVRGQILNAQGDASQAVSAYREALAAVPAQSARIALMTALAASGRRGESEALAVEVQSAPSSFDPWWAYWFGESLIYSQILAVIRANLQ